MARKILILGASYGSLLGMKLAMAGHDVTLVCRADTAALINKEGVQVRLRFKGDDDLTEISSVGRPGRLDALTPAEADPSKYHMIALAMQEGQYAAPDVAALMRRIAKAQTPCLSIMNMPPPPYLRRIPGLDTAKLDAAYVCPHVWDGFRPDRMTLCSPDPQAFRPVGGAKNELQVGLATNFKVAKFDDPNHTAMLMALASDIDDVRYDGRPVPVRLRVSESLYTPLAKWAMLLTGNYRCLTLGGQRPIREAVHAEISASRVTYAYVNALVGRLGAAEEDLVPFEKYAKAAESLIKPSSAARAIAAGATDIERVDRLVQMVGEHLGATHPMVDAVVRVVNHRLTANVEAAAEAEVMAARHVA